MANEERPTITWKRDEPQRPTIQRPAPERPTITLGDTPAASPAQRPAPTPTQRRQDTGSHPGRKVDRPAHISRLAHITTIHTNNAIEELNNEYPEEAPDTLITPEDMQGGLDYYRKNRHKVGYDEDLQNIKSMIETSFENRHDPKAKNYYVFEDED